MVQPVPSPQYSPLCQEGRHFQCAGWWWHQQDKIALVCKHWCHTQPVPVSNSGPAVRAG